MSVPDLFCIAFGQQLNRKVSEGRKVSFIYLVYQPWGVEG